jgi:FkbM family methyltransferase
VSYAQNGEDIVLNRAFKDQTSGFYIDVGAWDPDSDSVTRLFYERGWRGINIEPTQHYFSRLTAARQRDVNLQVAVGNNPTGKARFVQFKGSGLSGFEDSLNAGAIDTAEFGFEKSLKDVDVVPLSEIAQRYAPETVDFLKIDVEGAERSVIESADWNSFRPRVIVVEAVAAITHEPTWSRWEDILLDANYEFALFDGLNRFYFRSEEPALRTPLSYSACVTDYFVHEREFHMANRVRQLERMLDSQGVGRIVHTVRHYAKAARQRLGN